MADFITKIKLNDTNNSNEIPIGVDAEHVFFEETVNGSPIYTSLKNFYNNLQNFFKNKIFVYQGEEEPKSENVVVWNQVYPKKNN